MSRRSFGAQDPELFYNGGYFDHEDDFKDTAEDSELHIFNPFLSDPSARLDTFRDDIESEVGTDLDPEIDAWDTYTA